MKPRVRILVISRSPKLHPQIPPEGAIQLRVGVEACGGQAPVAEHLLHKVGRGAAARRGRVLELVRGDVFSPPHGRLPGRCAGADGRRAGRLSFAS